MTLYHNVSSNLTGRDRVNAMEAMKDDAKFDAWIAEFDAEQKRRSLGPKAGGTTGTRMSQDAYLKKHAKVYGGEE